MNRLHQFAPLLAVLLTACSTLPERNALAIYDFGLPAQRLVSTVPWNQIALELRAPAWLEAPGMAYRLAYEDPLRWRTYADSRWADGPALLLTQRLRQQRGLTATPPAPCQLRLELQEFAQWFMQPQQSRGVLQVSVTLLDAGRQLLAEKQWRIEQDASTADARGGAHALAAAGTAFGEQLADWLEHNATKNCRGTVKR